MTVGRGANDGEKGEGDKVLKTVEVVFGGADVAKRVGAGDPVLSCVVA